MDEIDIIDDCIDQLEELRDMFLDGFSSKTNEYEIRKVIKTLYTLLNN